MMILNKLKCRWSGHNFNFHTQFAKLTPNYYRNIGICERCNYKCYYPWYDICEQIQLRSSKDIIDKMFISNKGNNS